MISYIVYDTYGISFHKLSSLGCSNLVEIQNTKVVLTRIIDIYEGIFIPSYHMKRTLLLDCLVVEISLKYLHTIKRNKHIL